MQRLDELIRAGCGSSASVNDRNGGRLKFSGDRERRCELRVIESQAVMFVVSQQQKSCGSFLRRSIPDPLLKIWDRAYTACGLACRS